MSCDSQTLKQAVCQTLFQFAKACHLLGLARGVTAYHSRKRIFRSFTCLVEVRVAGDGVDVYRWWNGECTWLKFIQHVMKIPVGLLRMYVSSNSYCSEVYLFNSYLFMFHSEHERNCQYAPTQCPNSSQCPTLLKMVSPDRLQIQKQFGWRSNLAASWIYPPPSQRTLSEIWMEVNFISLIPKLKSYLRLVSDWVGWAGL